MALLYPATSQSFSKARWRYPISTSALTMVSPSSSVVIRMIPCIAGWAGPTPTCRFWLPLPVPLPSPSMNSRRVVPAMAVLVRGTDQRLPPVDRLVLAQWVADELLVHEEPHQIRVAAEPQAEHVPHLALEPVRDGPEADGARHDRIVLLHARLDPHAVVVGHRVEVVDDLEARPVLAPGIPQVVHRGEVHEHVEGERRLVATAGEYPREGLARHDRGRVAPVVVRLDDVGTDARADRVQDRRGVHHAPASRA